MNTQQQIKDMMDSNGYRVVAHVGENYCNVNFPNRAEEPVSQPFVVLHSMTESSVDVTILNNVNIELDKFYINCSHYAQRLVCLYNILFYCHSISYDFEYVKFINDNNSYEIDEFSFFLVCKPITDPEEIKKEMMLKSIATTMIREGNEDAALESAEQYGVGDGLVAVLEALGSNR